MLLATSHYLNHNNRILPSSDMGNLLLSLVL